MFSTFFSAGFASTADDNGTLVSVESDTFLSPFCCTVVLSLASTTPAPKNKPTPIRTLAAPTLNFLWSMFLLFQHVVHSVFLGYFFLPFIIPLFFKNLFAYAYYIITKNSSMKVMMLIYFLKISI